MHSREIRLHMQRDSDGEKTCCQGNIRRGFSASRMWQVKQGMAQVQREGGKWGREKQVQREWTSKSDDLDAKTVGR